MVRRGQARAGLADKFRKVLQEHPNYPGISFLVRQGGKSREVLRLERGPGGAIGPAAAGGEDRFGLPLQPEREDLALPQV